MARGQARHARRVTARTTAAGEPASRACPAAGGSGSRTSALAARSRGQRLCRRPRDRARRAVPAGPPPAGVLLPATAPLMRAPRAGPGLPEGPQPGGTRHKTGTTTTARHRPATGGLHQPAMPSASGMSAVPRGHWRASPHCSCPRRHLAAAGPAAARAFAGTPSAHPVPGPVVPHKPALRTLASRCPGSASSPVRPLISHASAGPWPLLSRTRSGADLAGQYLAGPGYGPDLCPYRQPGATSRRVCRMFPIACYGLTPRCREVKR